MLAKISHRREIDFPQLWFRKACEIHFPQFCKLAKWPSNLVQLSSNGHNFFILALNCTPFEALDSWLPELRNDILQWTPGSTLNFSCSCSPFEFRIAMKICFMLDFSLCFSSFASLDWLGNLLPRVAQNSPSFLVCFNDKKATKNTKTSQKLISNTCKGP